MGEWLATVRFPDGSQRYARYSTVVECVLADLYPEVDRSQGRARPVGEPSPGRPTAPPSPIDELVRVLITVDPEEDCWHALFDPGRDLLLGPHSGYRDLQADFSLVSDESGVRHLCAEAPRALCGRTAAGPESPFHRPLNPFGLLPESDVPDMDPYAEWVTGTICRDCLVAAL